MQAYWTVKMLSLLAGYTGERRPQPGQHVDCFAGVGHNQGSALRAFNRRHRVFEWG